MKKLPIRIAAITAFLGIALGAFGAHGLADRLEETGRLDNWETAVLYHLVHAVALFALALSGRERSRCPFACWLAGVVLFSGSLYALALTGVTALGAITPFGGIAFLAGWICLLCCPPSGQGPPEEKTDTREDRVIE